MAKTEKELNELKEIVEDLGNELGMLTAEDLSRVCGGSVSFCSLCNGAGHFGDRKCPKCAGSGVYFSR